MSPENSNREDVTYKLSICRSLRYSNSPDALKQLLDLSFDAHDIHDRRLGRHGRTRDIRLLAAEIKPSNRSEQSAIDQRDLSVLFRLIGGQRNITSRSHFHDVHILPRDQHRAEAGHIHHGCDSHSPCE